MTSNPSNPNASTSTTTYADTETTSHSTVIPSIITRSEQIAHYFADDLEEFLRLTHIDLAKELQIPYGYSHDSRDIVSLLYDDLSHMLRDELITGIHLLLSDNRLDSSTGAYLVRYHVQYTVDASRSLSSSVSSQPQRFGGLVAPPKDVWWDARFALLIDWNKGAGAKRYRVRRPDYNFDWVPEASRFDATSVLLYRQGSLTADSATVVRVEKW